MIVEDLLRRRAWPILSVGSPTRPRSTTTRSTLLAARAGGDARTALGALERAVEAARAGGGAGSTSRPRRTRFSARRSPTTAGRPHYDYISAWIKATRGSDVDASIYYLAVMLEGGEDPRFIARRMVIFASEDIGNADPQALVVATAAGAAVDRVGLPECALNLAQAAAYLALAPKSNASTVAIGPRLGTCASTGAKLPPDQLRGRPLPGRQGARPRPGLQYPHDDPGASPTRVAAPGRGPRRSASTSRPTGATKKRLARAARGTAGGSAATEWCQAPHTALAIRAARHDAGAIVPVLGGRSRARGT